MRLCYCVDRYHSDQDGSKPKKMGGSLYDCRPIIRFIRVVGSRSAPLSQMPFLFGFGVEVPGMWFSESNTSFDSS